MTSLTSKRRNDLPKSKFAEPAQRKYPIDTKARAANAKARAEQQYKAGKLSISQKDHIDAAANKVLNEK